MEMMADLAGSPAVMKVVGVGGGGCNAVNRMIDVGLGGVEFIAVNTDRQVLGLSNAPVRVCIGPTVTRGRGAGGDPAVGARSADESREELCSVLEGADLVFVTAGMGGGTGTGASPIVAEIAGQLGALTVAVVTKPFGFELDRKRVAAEEGLKALAAQVDTLIAIENDRLLQLVDRHVPLSEAFLLADDILRQGIQGISELVTNTGTINTDFNDVRAIMENGGTVLMSIGRASGDERALAAAQQAITSPLLDMTLSGASSVLFNIKGGSDLSPFDVDQAAQLITRNAAPDANIIWGLMIDKEMGDQLEITLIATGFASPEGIETPVPPRAASMPTTGPVRRQEPPVQLDKADIEVPPFLRRRGGDGADK